MSVRKVFCVLLLACVASAATPTVSCEEFCSMLEQANSLFTVNCTGQVNVTNAGNTSLYDTNFTNSEVTWLTHNRTIVPSESSYFNYSWNKTDISSSISATGVNSDSFLFDYENFTSVTLIISKIEKEYRNQSYRAVVTVTNPTNMDLNITSFELRRESASLLRFDPSMMGTTSLTPTVPFNLTANSEYFGDVIETLGTEPIYILKTTHEVLVSKSETQNITNFTSYGGTLAPPIITIESPSNGTYYAVPIAANVTLSRAGDSCLYSISGAANVTLSNDTSTHFYKQITTLNTAEHNITFWCNDTYGNGASATRYFTKTVVPAQEVVYVPQTGDVSTSSTGSGATTVTRSTSGGWGGGGRLAKTGFNATKTLSDSIVKPGDFVTVIIELKNTGEGILNRFLIIQPLPDNVAYVGGNGVWDGEQVWFEVDRLKLDETVPLTLTLQILGEVDEIPKTHIYKGGYEALTLKAIPFGHELAAAKFLLVKKRFHLLEDGRYEIEIRIENDSNITTTDFTLVDFFSTPSISNIQPAPSDVSDSTITWEVEPTEEGQERVFSYIASDRPDFTYPQVFGVTTHIVETSVSFEELFVQTAEWGGATESMIISGSVMILIFALYLAMKSKGYI